MNSDLDKVTEWLLNASSVLRPIYFQLPVAGKEEPEYRERVYCYELYHLWRNEWSEDYPFSLGGEIDKTGHPLIRDKYKPDFLVHIPGVMKNLLVMEVKSKNTDALQIIADLEKLTYFRKELKDQFNQPANYEAAYFWIYGISINEWKQLSADLLIKSKDNQRIDFSLISPFVHESYNTKAIEVSFS